MEFAQKDSKIYKFPLMHKYNCYLYGAFLDVDKEVHHCLDKYGSRYEMCEKCLSEYEKKYKMGWVPNDKQSW
jgi:hypothetical protein